MACACKVNRDIEYLQKRYGVNGKQQPKTNITGMARAFFYWMMAFPIVLATSPFIFIYLIFRNRKKPISIRKTMNFIMHPFNRKKNERDR